MTQDELRTAMLLRLAETVRKEISKSPETPEQRKSHRRKTRFKRVWARMWSRLAENAPFVLGWASVLSLIMSAAFALTLLSNLAVLDRTPRLTAIYEMAALGGLPVAAVLWFASCWIKDCEED